MKPYLDKLLADGSEARLPTFDRIEDNLNLDLFNIVTGNSNEQQCLHSTDKSEAG